jgi:hypothetical protein
MFEKFLNIELINSKLMSDRPFFNIRFAYPGYTYLLFIGLLSFEKLQSILKEPVGLWETIIGFLLLLSGAPLGFLISQTWYLIFGLYLKTDSEEFVEKYLIVSKCHNEEVRNYVFRRVDILNTLGSTMVSITLSIITSLYINGSNINCFFIMLV